MTYIWITLHGRYPISGWNVRSQSTLRLAAHSCCDSISFCVSYCRLPSIPRILFTLYIHQYESWGNCYSISKQSMVHNVCFVHPNLKACWLDQIKISFGGHIDAFIEYKQKCLRQMVLFHPIIWWFWFVHCSHVDNYIRCCKWMTLLLVNDCNVWIVIAECWSRIQYFLHFHAWFLSLEYGKEVCASKLDGATDQRQLISSSLLSPVVFLQEGHLVLLSSVKKAICSALWETTVWNGICQ